MAKTVFTIEETRHPLYSDRTRVHEYSGTIEELVRMFGYTLEVGESWQRERGNKKINRNPKTINSLCRNLENAHDNAARNGYGGYSYKVVRREVIK